MARANSATRQCLRVLAIPGRRHAQNSYFSILWEALTESGLEMIEARTPDALMFRYDVLHVHFPEHFITERSLYKALILGPLFIAYAVAAKIAGKKIVWTIHEVAPTRRHWAAQPYLWCMRSLVSAYIFMNRTTEDEFLNRYPRERRKAIARIPHSSYPVTKISAKRSEHIRSSLTEDADSLIVGFLGEIKPYKNVEALRHLPPTDAEDRPLRLVVAGACHASCDIDNVEAIFRAIGPHRLRRINERLSDERLSELIQAVDVVLLPYLRGWNSGLAMLALACRTPILCSGLPMFREIEQALGPPWVYKFDHNTRDLSRELHGAVAQIRPSQVTVSDEDRLTQFITATSFEKAASQHVGLYLSLLGRRRSCTAEEC